MLEKNFATKVLRLLRADTGGHWRKNPVSAYGSGGVGDIVGCVNGRYVEVELKAPGRYKDVWDGLSEIQKKHGQEIIAYGGVWVCGDDYQKIKTDLYAQLNRKQDAIRFQ